MGLPFAEGRDAPSSIALASMFLLAEFPVGGLLLEESLAWLDVG